MFQSNQSHLTGKHRNSTCRPLFLFFFPVRIGYCTTPCYNVIRDLFVLLTFAKAEVIWFDTLVSDQSFAFLHVFAYWLGVRLGSRTKVWDVVPYGVEGWVGLVCMQVSWQWRSLADSDELWIALCQRLGWTLRPVSPFDKSAWKRLYVDNIVALKRTVPTQVNTLVKQW